MSDTLIQPVEEASPAAQEILKELQAEGHSIESQQQPVKQDDSTPAPQPKKDEEQPKDDSNVPGSEPQETPKNDQVDQSNGKAKQQPREPKFVPVGKYNEQRHELSEAKKQLEVERAARVAAEQKAQSKLVDTANTTADKPTSNNLENVRKVAKDLAEKHGIAEDFVEEFASEMVKIAESRNVLPKEISEKLEKFDKISKELESKHVQQQEEAGFNSEYSDILKEFPELAPHKDQIKQLAFSEGYERTPLRLIALGYMHDNPVTPRKTAEAPGNGRSTSVETIDFENVTEEQFKNFNDDQLEKYQLYQEKKSRR